MVTILLLGKKYQGESICSVSFRNQWLVYFMSSFKRSIRHHGHSAAAELFSFLVLSRWLGKGFIHPDQGNFVDRSIKTPGLIVVFVVNSAEQAILGVSHWRAWVPRVLSLRDGLCPGSFSEEHLCIVVYFSLASLKEISRWKNQRCVYCPFRFFLQICKYFYFS